MSLPMTSRSKAHPRLGSASKTASPRDSPKLSRKTKSPTSRSTKKKTAGKDDRGAGRSKVARHVDSTVAARNSALNAMGGVKVDVFVRVRPMAEQEEGDEVSVTVDPVKHEIELMDVAGHPATYGFDKVYGPESTQEGVYDDCVSPIVEQVCRGLSCAIFAYGQTGTGKTYTMRGDLSSDPNQRGIIQRSVAHLYKRLEEHDYTDVSVKCSFLEIYMEELEDLFVDPPKNLKPHTKVRNKLRLVDDTALGCRCDGLKEVPVETVDQVMELLLEAEKRCKFSETKMNKLSNRAHRIFTLKVTFKRYEKNVLSTLTFVDLAGSEDISKSGAKGLTAREASSINKSLLTLGRVINGLACNEKHIPYRDSKLTRLLSEALGGVCKTSFIACVSPCGSSRTESTSTLRYAERAMEALNISQLPRWKQDEIMIDGLTRRVQQLVDELDSVRKIHREEMTDIKNERDTLKEENQNYRVEVGQLKRKIERLLMRKAALKQGLAVMTNNRDLHLKQKEALQKELLKTRQVRDGYLSDRESLCQVLESVRVMRERLLDAHNNTEVALTKDAQTLKKTIGNALAEMDTLHAEIARKKTMSVSNEKLADDFRDRMSGKLRELVQSVSDFKGNQDTSFGQVRKMLTDLRGERQREAGNLRNELAKLSQEATSVFSEITQQASSTEHSTKARAERNRDTAEMNNDMIAAAAQKLNEDINEKLSALHRQSNLLNETMQSWTDKVKTKLEENEISCNEFTSDVMSHVSAVQAHMDGASTAQLVHLKEHSDALQQHLESEKTVVAKETEKLVTDVSAYLQRMMADYSSQVIRRTEQAVVSLQAETEAISNETEELVAHQNKEFADLNSKVDTWNGEINKSIDDGLKSNKASHFTASGILKKINGHTQETVEASKVGQDTFTELSGEQFAAWKDVSESTIAAAEQTTEAFGKLITKGNQQVSTHSEQLREAIHSKHEKFQDDAENMDGEIENTHEAVKDHAGAHTDDLFDTEAVSVHYVMQEIQRDPKENPQVTTYKYPTEYKATEKYEIILQDKAGDLDRELAINEGQKVPGAPVDFPGELAPEDDSGLLTSTQTKPLPSNDMLAVNDASRDSDAGEYSDNPNENYGDITDEEEEVSDNEST